MKRPEEKIEEHFTRRVRALGGEVRKVSWIGRRGAPDRLALFPGRVVWVELKAPRGRLSGAQQREHFRLRRAGQEVVVLWSHAEVEEWQP